MNLREPHFNPARTAAKSFGRRAFTLIEIMVVVAIIGIIMAAGAPTLYKVFHKEGFRKTVSDIVDVCSAARAEAIMHDKTTEVIFHPQERTCEVSGAVGRGGGWAHSAKLDDGTTIEMLDVNLFECKDADEVGVRFYPNSTCDEMTLILRSADNEWRKISLEITTGLVSVDSNPDKWK
jgi:prepilin-type N-terminal cleavage/methylation domain-containing protein